MVVEQLVLKKKSLYLFKDSDFLKDFDETKLKIAQHDCVYRTIYHVDYTKDMVRINPLYLVISECYGYIEERKGQKYLNIAPIESNKEVLIDYKNIWNKILEHINKIDNSNYAFREDFYEIKVGSIKCDDNEEEEDKINLLLNKLLKIIAAKISCRLIIEKNNKLFLEIYLEECFYNKVDDEV